MQRESFNIRGKVMAHILIVDDSPTYIEAMRHLLEQHGYTCTVAQTGQEGIETAIKLQPDLILMDVIMPVMSGFQATRQLSKNPATANIPIVIVSTKDQETDRLWGLRQGAKAYLVKEVAESELISCVEGLLKV